MIRAFAGTLFVLLLSLLLPFSAAALSIGDTVDTVTDTVTNTVEAVTDTTTSLTDTVEDTVDLNVDATESGGEISTGISLGENTGVDVKIGTDGKSLDVDTGVSVGAEDELLDVGGNVELSPDPVDPVDGDVSVIVDDKNVSVDDPINGNDDSPEEPSNQEKPDADNDGDDRDPNSGDPTNEGDKEDEQDTTNPDGAIASPDDNQSGSGPTPAQKVESTDTDSDISGTTVKKTPEKKSTLTALPKILYDIWMYLAAGVMIIAGGIYVYRRYRELNQGMYF